MDFVLTDEWRELLSCEMKKAYFEQMKDYLNEEYATYTIFPTQNLIFNALNLVPYKNIKVVIVGQDPYYKKNQANGLAFSVNKGVPLPPSLKNIYKELANSTNFKFTNCGDLTSWAKQGVLLLNTVLTVREGYPNSHKTIGWEKLTTAIIRLINNREKPVIFLLWGNNAQKFASQINAQKHFILTTSHPSPLSAYQGFLGCNHFTKANEILTNKLRSAPINWNVVS